MKKPVRSIDEPEQKKATRADRRPTEGFVVIVDGHFKSEFGTVEEALFKPSIRWMGARGG